MKTHLILFALFLSLHNLSVAQQTVDLEIVNQTNVPIEVYWVDEQGNEQLLGQLQAGLTHQQQTYAAQQWIFKSGNQVVGTMTVSNHPAQQYIIGQASPLPVAPAPIPIPAPMAPAPTVQPQQAGGNGQLSAAEMQQLLQLVNQARANEGAAPLRYNAKLTLASQKHSVDMLARSYFNHNAKQPAPDGVGMSDRATKAGYDWSAIAENIANGQTTVQAVFAGWMSSVGHRANIVNPDYTEMGVGRAGNLWTQMFGKGW